MHNTRNKAAASAFALTAGIALLGAIGPANAETLTAEQLALIKKYGISEADQQKLFGTATGKKPAAVASTKPVRVEPVQAEPAFADTAIAEPAPPADAPATGFLAGTYVFSGFETYKSIGERLTNINGGTGSLTGSFGAVVGFNSGHTLTASGFGIQAGASFGLYDFKGRLRIVPDATAPEKQSYFTVGLYKHGNTPGDGGSLAERLSFGIVLDTFQADRWGINANEISLSQVRGTIGFAVSDSTEIGVWATHGLDTDQAAVTVAGDPNVRREIRAMDQTNLYVKHSFESGANISAYIGAFESDAIGEWQVGMTAQVPLNPNWAMYGSANYVIPGSASGPKGSGEEQFSLSLGLAYHFGGNADSGAGGKRQLPLLDVASNRTFLITD